MVDEPLVRNARLFADACKDSGRNSIRSVFLSGIELYYRTATEHRMVGRVVFLWIVRMPGVGIVRTYHKSLLYGSVIVVESLALRKDYALDDRGKEWRACALLSL